MNQGKPDFPPVVYVPTTTVGGELRVDLQRTADGRVALFSYSAIDRLHAKYAARAPWVLLSVDDLQRVYDETPYDLLLLDAERRGPEDSGEGQE